MGATRTFYFPSLPLIKTILLISLLPSHLKGSTSTSSTTQEPFKESSRLLDLLLRDYILNSFKNQHYSVKTGVVRHIHLPSNYSGINLDAVRFRCGSFRRYGAQLQEFHIGVGAILEPCGERLVLVRQILGSNWSDIYYKNYDLSGYRLVSPVLGLLVYNALNDVVLGNNFRSSYQISLLLDNAKDPSTVDFGNISGPSMVERTFLNKPMCAAFGLDGKVTFAGEVKPYVCAVKTNGHFGLVVTDDQDSSKSAGGGEKEMKKEKIGRWRSVVGGLIGSVTVGIVLLGLVMAATVVTAKKRGRRAKREEMERKACEEEALRVVTMVGHSRVFVASATRTLPSFMEHECVPN
ncbi:hypothetical protein BRARA_I01202 [Brassica rapa]|uniref:Uncharacterized protein n=3 Tax=Brassica TaxID=3705 RepID=A0A397Y0X1_BRACM|nr:hypothetical protein IGI04_034109 [Brassica rapa subsp. trilocularis]RID44410.1 hypothetical protein BRARA_I01202 [Brassica rapa]CAF2038967.1 unnamed protein product [Brassica napus]CAG7860958.1 unnamed protein product [Brassica rapa]CDY64891.1 BnaA09g52980D [Brassica napus]